MSTTCNVVPTVVLILSAGVVQQQTHQVVATEEAHYVMKTSTYVIYNSGSSCAKLVLFDHRSCFSDQFFMHLLCFDLSMPSIADLTALVGIVSLISCNCTTGPEISMGM